MIYATGFVGCVYVTIRGGKKTKHTDVNKSNDKLTQVREKVQEKKSNY